MLKLFWICRVQVSILLELISPVFVSLNYFNQWLLGNVESQMQLALFALDSAGQALEGSVGA